MNTYQENCRLLIFTLCFPILKIFISRVRKKKSFYSKEPKIQFCFLSFKVVKLVFFAESK